MSHALSDGPLAGLRVIDFTRVVAGPLTAQCLADLGADVIKVERPGSGDDTRQWPPYFKDADGEDVLGESVYIQVTNRNKRSITVDIRQPEGQALMKRLMGWADVFIENLKVGDLDRYGLSYDKVKDEHSHLIYCSVTGFGQTGPYAKRPGYDILAQGAAGLMSVTGEPDGLPMKVGVAVGDIQAGLHAAVAILAAVHARTATGKGQWIDVSLLDCQAWGMINFASNYLNAGMVATRNGTAHPSVVPYQVFESRDGHVILGVTTDYQFAKFCECAGTSQWVTDDRFATTRARVENRAILVPLVAEVMATRDTADWVAALEAAGVSCGPVNRIDQAFQDTHLLAREMIVEMDHGDDRVAQPARSPAYPVKLSETPASYRRPAPTLGQHSREILHDLGYDDGEIAALRENGAI